MEQSIIRLDLMRNFPLFNLILHKLMFPCTHYNDMVVIHGKLFLVQKHWEQAIQK